jgi:hypothetical protein
MDTTELVRLASIPIEREKKKIKLVISNIEGCLNLDEHTYDLEALSWMRVANQLAEDNPIPFITVCSGRQHAFVEAITQMIAGKLPAVFENGCGLYFPTRSLYKEMMLSLHPLPPFEVREVLSIVTGILAEKDLVATVTRSASAVDITPIGIDKAAGVKWLLDTLKEVLSVTKRKAELQRKLGHTGTTKRMERMTNKRNRRIDHYMHTASKWVIDLLVKEGIGVLCKGQAFTSESRRSIERSISLQNAMLFGTIGGCTSVIVPPLKLSTLHKVDRKE